MPVSKTGSVKMKAMVKKMALAVPVNRAQKAFLQIAEETTNKNIEDTLLYKTIKPLFILMKIMGIFFTRRKTPLNLHHRLRNFRKCSVEQVWCTFVLVILTVNFLRSLSTFANADFSSLSNKLFFKCLVVIFFYESMSRAALAYMASYREKGGLESLFMNMESVCYPDKIIPYESALVRTNWTFIGLTMFLSLCNLTSVIYGFYFASPAVMELFNAYLDPMPRTAPGAIVFEVFVVILTFLNVQVCHIMLNG